MNLRLLTVFIIVLTSFLAGCATPGMLPTRKQVDNTRTYNESFDDVWASVIGIIAEKNLNISTLEKDSGLIAINGSPYSPQYAFEGTRGSVLGVPDEVVDRIANMNIFATKLDQENTKVRVNIAMKMKIRRGNGSQAYPFTYGWTDSYSNGTIENYILSNIKKRISQN